MIPTVLHVRGLRKRYGAFDALRGIDLDIQRGELFGLLGPNGAGKTTFLSILSGLLDASEGEVELNGKLFRRSELSQRFSVGIGTQDLSIYPELTAEENLRFFGDLYSLSEPTLTTRIRTLLESVGLADRARDRVSTFSGGMKRRLNLAVAVVHEPELLLLDEPTTGVDPQSRNHIFEMVQRLNAAGMTIVYTSHYMEEVQVLCKRIAILDAGKILACDTLPNLLKQLASGLKLFVPTQDQAFLERLRQLPHVQSLLIHEGVVQLACSAIGPLLPAIAEVCRDMGVTPTAIETDEPSLEKVFLHLTGRDLRD